MKTLHLSIIVISCLIGAFVAWYSTSHDLTPVTKQNTFGLSAMVVHRPPEIGCFNNQCPPVHDYYLEINSKIKTILVGYNICDGDSCVTQDDMRILLPVQDVVHPGYHELQLPANLSWKVGDPVSIQAKITSTFILDSAFTPDPSHDPKIWVDLGQLKILESNVS
ncbi:MAG: hypothetical protein KGI19_10460 [Thaumarchaeota archaeon]|nr:hypothetical protein [Nitrososphaerota archaeon]